MSAESDRLATLASKLHLDLAFAAPEIQLEKILWRLLEAYQIGFDAGKQPGSELGASEIACAVADTIARVKQDGELSCFLEFLSTEEFHTLDRLESATRGSALRKVKP